MNVKIFFKSTFVSEMLYLIGRSSIATDNPKGNMCAAMLACTSLEDAERMLNLR